MSMKLPPAATYASRTRGTAARRPSSRTRCRRGRRGTRRGRSSEGGHASGSTRRARPITDARSDPPLRPYPVGAASPPEKGRPWPTYPPRSASTPPRSGRLGSSITDLDRHRRMGQHPPRLPRTPPPADVEAGTQLRPERSPWPARRSRSTGPPSTSTAPNCLAWEGTGPAGHDRTHHVLGSPPAERRHPLRLRQRVQAPRGPGRRGREPGRDLRIAAEREADDSLARLKQLIEG